MAEVFEYLIGPLNNISRIHDLASLDDVEGIVAVTELQGFGIGVHHTLAHSNCLAGL